MRTTFEITETVVVEARIEPSVPFRLAAEGAHARPTDGQMAEAARRHAQDLKDDLEDLGYGVRIERAEREVTALRRRHAEQQRIARIEADAEECRRRLRTQGCELEALLEQGRRLEYRARVERFKAHQASRLLGRDRALRSAR